MNKYFHNLFWHLGNASVPLPEWYSSSKFGWDEGKSGQDGIVCEILPESILVIRFQCDESREEYDVSTECGMAHAVHELSGNISRQSLSQTNKMLRKHMKECDKMGLINA